MHIQISQEALQSTVSLASSIVEKKNTLPILGHVLLRTNENTLTIQATDLDTSIVRDLEANIIEPGQIALPAQLLKEIVRRLPSRALIDIKTTDTNRTTLTCGSSVFNLSSLPGEDFPSISTEDSFTHEFDIKAKELAYLLLKTRFAMSTEETRYNLNGIYLHLAERDGERYLQAAATDSHRLAVAHISVPTGLTEMPGMIVSRKTVNELVRLIDECNAEDAIKVHVASHQISFHLWGTTFLTSRLIDGTFPDYESFIPYKNDRCIMLEKRKFTDAVERVSLVAGDKTRPVKFFADNNNLRIEALDSDLGDAVEQVEADFAGEPISAGFNSRYLTDISQQVSDDSNIELRLGELGSPLLVKEVGSESHLTVVMPLRV